MRIMNKPMTTLFKELIKYSQSKHYPFHMPGGKRNPKLVETGLPYRYDISEIEGFDDLHHGVGLIKELEKRASKCYGSDKSALLVNGSTSGLLSGIMACTNKGDKVLVGRGSHKSIYHGILLNELEAVYLYPEYDKEKDIPMEIKPEDVRQALGEDSDIKAVIVTSPTYDGVVSEIGTIAEIVHEKNIPLIVDEAHGAHFGFGGAFPENSNTHGADLVIHSLHKTLPSLTQTALIHKNGNLVDWEKVRFYLQIFQSSSPSYILMSSIDVCISMLEDDGLREKLFSEHHDRLRRARGRLKKLSNLELIETKNYDISKILISARKINKTGLELYNILLEKYQLQMEMATGSTVLAMTSISDTEEGLERLVEALEEIDGRYYKNGQETEKELFTGKKKQKNVLEENVKGTLKGQETEKGHEIEEEHKKLKEYGILNQHGKGVEDRDIKRPWEFPKLEQVYSISKALAKKEPSSRRLPFKDCEKGISREFVYLYPPGIPLIVPGERISLEAIKILLQYEKLGYKIKGIKNAGKIDLYRNLDVAQGKRGDMN
jgi:arginine/lysine/ornithine decarboxylase